MNRVRVLGKQTAGGERTADVVVFGSCFLDYVAYVKAIPKPGQTLGSESFAKGFGGKGANQAIMAARLGGRVRMVAAVGADGDGADYVANFERDGVDTQHVKRLDGHATGLAMIAVDVGTAQNAITICPNAAAQSSYDMHFGAADPLAGCKILVCQNEIPLCATLQALERAHGQGVYTIFNTAPAPAADEISTIQPYLKFVSLLCPNEHEAQLMTGVDVTDAPSAERAAMKLRELGVRDVVITLGANGASVLRHGDAAAQHITGLKVKAVDTTGAGDSFVGAMAFFLSKGRDLLTACGLANQCAAVSVTRRGTQASYPYLKDLPTAVRDAAA